MIRQLEQTVAACRRQKEDTNTKLKVWQTRIEFLENVIKQAQTEERAAKEQNKLRAMKEAFYKVLKEKKEMRRWKAQHKREVQ